MVLYIQTVVWTRRISGFHRTVTETQTVDSNGNGRKKTSRPAWLVNFPIDRTSLETLIAEANLGKKYHFQDLRTPFWEGVVNFVSYKGYDYKTTVSYNIISLLSRIDPLKDVKKSRRFRPANSKAFTYNGPPTPITSPLFKGTIFKGTESSSKSSNHQFSVTYSLVFSGL